MTINSQKTFSGPLVLYNVDGALAPPFATPPLKFKRFLLALNSKGVKQVLCSDKSAEYLSGLARGLGLDVFPWVIAENGGVLFNWRDLKKEYLLSEKEKKTIHFYRSKLEKKYKQWLVFKEPKETAVACYFRHHPSLFSDLQALKKKSEGVKFVLHQNDSLDILKIGVDKETAIKRFFEKIGVSDEELITCSDGKNDFGMLKVGFPITFRNASAVTKKMVKDRGGFVSTKSAPWGIVEAFSFLRNQGLFALPDGSFDFRPWGKWEVLDERKRLKVKYLEVKPRQRLSLQRHFHREEVWVVVEGRALVTKDKCQILLKEGETINIGKEQWHRIENPANKLLKIVEVQKGSYLEEDDIERAEDDYGRVK